MILILPFLKNERYYSTGIELAAAVLHENAPGGDYYVFKNNHGRSDYILPREQLSTFIEDTLRGEYDGTTLSPR